MNLQEWQDYVRSEAGAGDLDEATARDAGAIGVYLRDMAREAAEADQILVKMRRNKKPIKGFESGEVEDLRKAANLVHNVLGWLKHYQ